MSVAIWLGNALLAASVSFQSWILPAIIGIVALTLCWLASLHQQRRLPAALLGLRPLMSVLDRLTDKQAVYAAVAKITPQVKLDFDREKVAAYMKARILGYDDVIDDIVQQVWAGYKAKKRTTPIGVFLLVGPSLTGKTHFGEVLGHALFGDQGSYTIDLAALSGGANASSISGASPGYAGHGTSTGLITHLRANPASVVIVDEFEKADQAAQRQFLSAWNKGSMDDLATQGKVSTIHTVFVVTSNAAAEAIAELAATFTGTRDALSDRCKTLLKNEIEAPTLSRINCVFPLIPLQGNDLADLLGLLIERTLDKYGLQAAFGAVSATTVINYYAEAVQRGVDARAMAAKIGRDLDAQAAELADIDPPIVRLFERDGQVFIEPYRAPKAPPPKAPPPAKAAAPRARAR